MITRYLFFDPFMEVRLHLLFWMTFALNTLYNVNLLILTNLLKVTPPNIRIKSWLNLHTVWLTFLSFNWSFFGSEANTNVCSLQNCLYTLTLSNVTPYELWTDLKLDSSDLHITLVAWLMHIFWMMNEKKLDFKTIKCIFIGFGNSTRIKGYQLYNEDIKCILISCDVVFCEDLLLLGGPLASTYKSSSLNLKNNSFYNVFD